MQLHHKIKGVSSGKLIQFLVSHNKTLNHKDSVIWEDKEVAFQSLEHSNLIHKAYLEVKLKAGFLEIKIKQAHYLDQIKLSQ